MNDEIQNKAFLTYTKNMEFLKTNHKDLYDKLKLFELGLEIGQIEERYILELKDTYFDVYDNRNKSYLYNEDSLNYSSSIAKNISFESKVNSFRTAYDIEYEDQIAKKSIDLSMLSNVVFGNAPIIDYVNRNLPEKQEFKEIFVYYIFGVGLGLHVPFIHKKVNAKIYFIVEPSLELFRLSLFVTNYSELSKWTMLFFSIADTEMEFRTKFDEIYFKSLPYSHYIKFFPFIKNIEIYVNLIQNRLVTQGHILYSYNRELQSLHRTYGYAKEKYKIINISDNQNLKLFQNKKVLILAAGPSLQKNLEFVKNNQDKYIIVGILGIMPYLEENGIVPDIITQYDEQTKETMGLFNEVKDLAFFSNTMFLFSSHVCNELVKSIPKERLFLFHALFEAKKDFSYITAPSIGEITYALMLKFGVKDISLLGIDMALDPDTGKSHYDGYDKGNSFIEGNKEASMNTFGLKKNVFKIKGNFLPEVETLPIYKASIDHVNFFTSKFGGSDIVVYNLSNGAYFENIKPQKANELDMKTISCINKEYINKELFDSFNFISTDTFLDKDIEYNNQKLIDANKLKAKLDSFYIGRKYPNASDFRKVLHEIQIELLSDGYTCTDLQKIIYNYFSHNITYIFYIINLKDLDNPKKHIKQLYKIFYNQINRIIHEYMSYISLK